MKRSILNLLGGLLLCLPMLFTSCSEKDNALEQIVNQENLEGLKKALYKNAEVTVQFKVYGKTTPFTVTLKNVGTVEKPKYEVQGDFPTETEIGYKLTYDMGYIDDNLYFGLVYNKPVDTDADDESEDMFDLAPVMVVKFDTKTSKYDVYALPGFDFEVISINGTDMDVEPASEKTAYIKFYHYGVNLGTRGLTRMSAEDGPVHDLEMKINFKDGNTWEDLDEAYDEVGLGVFASISDNDGGADDNDDMTIDLSDYDFYFNDDDVNYWKIFVIFNPEGTTQQEKGDNLTETTEDQPYKAKDYREYLYLPVYGLNSKGNIALLDVLKLALPTADEAGTDDIQWGEIAAKNSDVIKVVKNKTTGNKTIVIKDNVVNDNGKNYYYSLYDGKSSYRVKAKQTYDQTETDKNYHFYQLKSSIRSTDEDAPVCDLPATADQLN